MESIYIISSEKIGGVVLEEAIKFFEDEIFQFNLQLGGILDDDYRQYLESKSAYYEMAARALRDKLE